MTIADLFSSTGKALLDGLPPYNESEVFTLTAHLRKAGYDPSLISTALTQNRLRAKALTKFPQNLCERMFFTNDGLEQATRHSIALKHAKHFTSANIFSIIDLGCGIGADSLAFAEKGMRLTAIEMQPETAKIAQHNLHYYPEAKVIEADGRKLPLQEFSAEAIWIDPARRKNGKRITNPQQWTPSLAEALSIAKEFKAAGIKVAPGISYQDLPSDSFVTWISADGDLLEAVIWLGTTALNPGRAAWVANTDDDGRVNFCELNEITSPDSLPIFLPARDLSRYIYEPAAAIIRAGLIHKLATKHALSPVSSKIAYLTGENAIDSPFLTCFEVQEVLPLNAKKVRTHLRALNIGNVEIKKRGCDISPDSFRKSLALNPKHKNSATLIATPVLGKHKLIIAQRHSFSQKQ